jgi:zinc protease
MEVTASAFKVHPYRHPTIGWQSDVETMTREDLFGHYKRYYTPSNATIVIVGDVETGDALRRVERQFGSIAANGTPLRRTSVEPRQEAERRVTLRKEGTTAYWKAVYHAPAFGDAAFFPLLVADAVLSGGAGLNIWSAGRVARPQRSSRLYRRVVDSGLASSVQGALLPTAQPFLYSISATVSASRTLAAVEDAVLDELDRLSTGGITEQELEKAKAQLRARFVFDMDGVTDIAHQLGYFETIGSWRDALTLGERLSAVSLTDVHTVARSVFSASNRTIGWFEPQADLTPQFK